jgi:hypothetical protein
VLALNPVRCSRRPLSATRAAARAITVSGHGTRQQHEGRDATAIQWREREL